MIRAALLALVSAAGLITCGQQPMPAQVLPSGWPVLRGSGPGWGFEVAVPSGWDYIARTSSHLDQDLTDVSKRHPAVDAYITAALQNPGERNLKLIAVDPASAASPFLTNFNLIVTDVGDLDHAPDLELVGRAKIAQLNGPTDIGGSPKVIKLTLPAGPAAKVAYTIKLASGTSAAVTSYLFLKDGNGHRFKYELTAGSANSPPPDEIFNKIAASLKLT